MPQSKSVGARLTAKVGPLPVWGWAVVILGAILLYMRTHKATADTTAVPTSDTSSGADSGAQVPAAGGGTPADNTSSELIDRLGVNTAALDALTAQILSMPTPYADFGDSPAAGVPASDMGQGVGPAAQPTVTQQPTQQQPAPAPVAQQVGGSIAHATQTKSGSLKWGGVTFTTRAAFDAWARAHGSTTTRELNGHPQARAIYSTLR